MRYLLDSDTCIHALKGRPEVIARMQALSPGDFGVSAITAYELFHGVEKCQSQQTERKKVNRFLEAIEVIDFSEDHGRESAVIRADLERKGAIIGPYDLLIAGQARALGLTLITHNTREFHRVAGLKVEDWIR